LITESQKPVEYPLVIIFTTTKGTLSDVKRQRTSWLLSPDEGPAKLYPTPCEEVVKISRTRRSEEVVPCRKAANKGEI